MSFSKSRSRWPLLCSLLLLGGAPVRAGEGELLVPLVPPSVRPSRKNVRSRPKMEARRKTERTLPSSRAAERGSLLELSGPDSLEGASVFIDGEDRGRFPTGPLPVSEGEHSVVVRQAGFREFHKVVSVAGHEARKVDVRLVSSGGRVKVATPVEGAEIWVGDELKGISPMEDFILPPGNHLLMIRKEGFLPLRQGLWVRAGAYHQLTVELRRAPSP